MIVSGDTTSENDQQPSSFGTSDSHRDYYAFNGVPPSAFAQHSTSGEGSPHLFTCYERNEASRTRALRSLHTQHYVCVLYLNVNQKKLHARGAGVIPRAGYDEANNPRITLKAEVRTTRMK